MGARTVTATRYIPRDGPRRFGSQPFRSRVDGHQRSKRCWICQPCNRWYEIAPAKSKGARRCECGTVVLHFGSEKEGQRWQQLRILLGHGRIATLKHHPRIDLVAPGPGGQHAVIGQYEADSSYLEAGEQIWEDVKPKLPKGDRKDIRAIDPLADWKMRHFTAQTGIQIRIIN